MKFELLSDLHLEFYSDGGRSLVEELPALTDTLVLAGDVCKSSMFHHVFPWFTAKWKNVVFVLGNHEYYRSSPDETAERLQRAVEENPRVHALSRGEVTIDGQRFIGATLWFPKEENHHWYKRELSDFHVISNFDPWVYEEHTRDFDYLKSAMQAGDVVVTHHLPHRRSIAPQYRASPINAFFHAADTDPLVERGAAAVWLHGHTYDPCDYAVNGTRVVCQPRGYPGEEIPWTQVPKVIECPDKR